MQKAKNDMDQTSNTSKRLKFDMDDVEQGLKRVGVAATASIGAAVYTAAGFEKSMSRVKALTGATEVEFVQLTDTARELGATTEFSAQEAAEGMQYLAMAGFDVNEIISAMPNVLNLASAAQVDLGTSADIVSNIMTGFGITAEETDRAVDVLVETMRSANTDLHMLGDAMKYVAPVAHGLGWSIEETASAIAAMSDAGIQGSQAGTSLRAALLSLASPTGQTEKAMKKFNIEVMDANGNMKPLPELVGHISERLGGLTKAQKTAALAQLVGREAASGFIAMIERGGPELQKFTEKLKNSEGVSKQVAETQRDNLVGSLQELESALEELGITIGNQFLPILRRLTDGITLVTDHVGKLNPELLAAALAFTAVGGSASAMALGTGTARKALDLLGIGLGNVAGKSGGKGGSGLKGVLSLIGTAGARGGLIGALAGLAAAFVITAEETVAQARADEEAKKALRSHAVEVSALKNEWNDLASQGNVTRDMLRRYADLQYELSQATDTAEQERLKKELAGIAKESGLSNDKFARLVEVSGLLAKKLPEATNEITNTGQALVFVNKETDKFIGSWTEDSLNMNLDKFKSDLDAVNAKLEKSNKEIKDAGDKYKENKKRIEEIDKELQSNNDSLNESNSIVGNRRRKLSMEKKILEGQNEELLEQLPKLREGATLSEKKRKRLNDQYQSLVNQNLEYAGITKKGQEGYNLAEKRLSTYKAEHSKLKSKLKETGSLSKKEQERLNWLESAIKKHETALNRIRSLTSEADSFNKKWRQTIYKKVQVSVDANYTRDAKVAFSGGRKWVRHQGGIIPTFHQGGVNEGEETFARMDRLAKKMIADFTNNTGGIVPGLGGIDARLYGGEMVFNKAQQRQLWHWVRSGGGGLPSRGSTSVASEDIDRIANRPVNVSVQIDGREVGRAVAEPVKEEHVRKAKQNLRWRGGGNRFS